MVARASRPRVLAAAVGALLATLAAAPSPAQKLYFTELDSQRVYRSNRDGASVEDLGPTSAPLGLVLDDTAGLRYWIVRTVYGGPTNGIVRSGLEPGSPVEVVADQTDGLLAPRALALDQSGGILYWTDNGAPPSVPARIQRCEVADCRGTLTTLVGSGVVDPVGIAVDAAAGAVYWVEHDADLIRRANVDGTGVTTLASGAVLSRPEGIALDVTRDQVYWTETVGNRIQRASLDGSGREVVLESPAFLDLVEIKVDGAGGLMYFADYTADRIQRAATDGSGLTDLLTGRSGPWGVALDRPPCALDLELTQGHWHQVALPCDPGAAAAVADVFSDLGGSQNEDWALFEWDPVGGRYVQLGPADTLTRGRGYWVKTLLAGQSATLDGIQTDTAQRHPTPLVASPDGEWNMVGHPFDLDVEWASVRVLHDGQLLTLDQADPVVGTTTACSAVPPDPACILSRVAYAWNGASYQAFNGLTPGAEGILEPAMGFWVRAFDDATLLVSARPAPPAGAQAETRDVGAEGWWVRLTVSADGLEDAGNVLGEVAGAGHGHDPYDLPELEPFAADFLTVVFPHPDWGDHAGDFTTDLRPVPADDALERWRFEVRSGVPGRRVTLTWSGPEGVLERSVLVDLNDADPTAARPRVAIPVTPGGSYTAALDGRTATFEWVVAPAP